MMRRRTIAAAFLAFVGMLGCGGRGSAPSGNGQPAAVAKIDAVVLITIDTLRADRVGAYGWRAARTSAIDALAARGVRAERAYATAPITLPSHASVLTGVYPSRHGARHNGMRVKATVPTLAEMMRARGFATGAFIAAFPLDRRFGLDRGFDVYGDTLPRGTDGRSRNERSGQAVVDEALAWVAKTNTSGGTANAPGGKPLFLWVHLFEPHAPYEADAAMGAGGHSTVGRSVSDRYDDEVARADRQVARIVDAFAPRRASTVFIVAADHGEAFGEHGEVGHSLFVYDSTLRVPLILAGPGIDSGGRPYVDQRPVSLLDIVPTVVQLVGLPPVEGDGLSLLPLSAEQRGRGLYAESYAPLLDFGWSPLRAMRSGRNKYIAAPKPELYDIADDPAESRNLAALPERVDTATELQARAERISPADLVIPPPDVSAKDAAGRNASGQDAARAGAAGADASGSNTAAGNAVARNAASRNAASRNVAADRESLARLQSLGYVGAQTGGAKADATGAITISAKDRPDPKDRVELAARIGQVTSGELHGPALRAALERIVRDDPKNGQMRMRLAFTLQESGNCAAAVPHFEAAIAAAVPSADPHLGLAECLAATGRGEAARRALIAADRIEPGNPIVSANLGLMALDAGRVPEAIDRLKTALARVPDLHEARFALVRAYARDGNRDAAASEAEELLKRMPADAPQRAEVERLLAVVR
jgi:arylsulfatase A-like enzyme/cytochrome c-type biogenesis protein CcmH/NrfG